MGQYGNHTIKNIIRFNAAIAGASEIAEIVSILFHQLMISLNSWEFTIPPLKYLTGSPNSHIPLRLHNSQREN